MRITSKTMELLVCPRSHIPLKRAPGSSCTGTLVPIGRVGLDAPQIGLTEELFVSPDGDRAYPIQDGIPALLWPDVLLPERIGEIVDLRDLRYQEAYSEMRYYNPFAVKEAEAIERSFGYREMNRIRNDAAKRRKFPEPVEFWISPNFDIRAKMDCDQYIAPVTGKTVLSLGGQGREAVRLLLAGAEEAILVTPMIGECILGWTLAEKMGVADRFSCVLGIGEEIPLKDGAVDVISSQGCVHHMRLDLAIAEIHRVLKPGGRFVAVDPWRTPLYAFGRALIGQREQGLFNRSQSVFCKPLTDERIAALKNVFGDYVVRNHGPFLRYLGLALIKFGVHLSPRMHFKFDEWDETLMRLLHLSPRWGGSVMIGGQRKQAPG